MTERSLIDWLRKQPGVEGLGDDCAVVPAGRGDLVYTTDLLIEDVHFLRSHPAPAVGHKALARGLSDLAAMGAQPVAYLLSLALPEWADRNWVRSFYSGMLALGRRHGAVLIGGDLARSNRVTADIVGIGRVPKGRALRRSGAQVGDGIYVSGELGAAAVALARGESHCAEPRVELGLKLRGVATACMDLSDGLSIDLDRLCRESGVGAELDGELPLAAGATVEQALHGGEDYELLFTLPRGVRGATRVGVITDRSGVRYRGRRLRPLGHDHFRR